MKVSYAFVCAAVGMATVAACGGPSSDDVGSNDGGKGGRNAGGASAMGGKGGGGGGSSGGKGGTGAGGATVGGAGSGGVGGSGGGSVTEPLPSGKLADGLVGYWPFEEGSGTAIKDQSGNDNNGTAVEGGVIDSPVSTTVAWGPGKKGKAITLDGTNDWIKVARSDSLDTTGTNGSVTVAAWIKMKEYQQAAALSAFNFFVCRQEVGTSYEHFGLAVREGKPTAAIHFFFATAAETIPLDTWSHVAMTYDGVTMTVFTNGVPSSSIDIGWPIAADTTPLTIGGAQNVDTVKEFVSGSLDEVYLYNRSLSPAEVMELMTSAK